MCLFFLPMSVDAPSRAWVCGRSLVGTAVSNPAGDMDVCRVVCCQVEVFASGPSLVQRTPNECGVSECHCEASIMRRSWPTGAVESRKKKFSYFWDRIVLIQAKPDIRLWC